eukprot:gnl/MRDRNA2_/MRDRNA2_43895_c0_seq1.p1 gnl/MRDRNA2_/MRDRNA2_43895_c0~~gnl/MRDRNA2_/MRDRNA2_43895_c0_seq1.p1  ORF type:complete len:106 (-),score=17.98 gnl/MRDRNA2_/MRDRNA2_43895_c0_seq1:676-993(-)
MGFSGKKGVRLYFSATAEAGFSVQDGAGVSASATAGISVTLCTRRPGTQQIIVSSGSGLFLGAVVGAASLFMMGIKKNRSVGFQVGAAVASLYALGNFSSRVFET